MSEPSETSIPKASAGAAATGATLASAGGAWAGDIATAAAGACAMDGATGVRTGLSTGAEDRGETSTIGTCTGAKKDRRRLGAILMLWTSLDQNSVVNQTYLDRRNPIFSKIALFNKNDESKWWQKMKRSRAASAAVVADGTSLASQIIESHVRNCRLVMTCHDIDSSKRLQHHQYHNITRIFPMFSRILHLHGTCRDFSSRSLWCQGRLRSDGRQHHRRRRRRRLRHGLDGLDGEAATSMTLRTLSAFHRFQMFEGIGIQVQQSSTYFNISRQKHHETSTVLLFYSGFVNRISRYTYPSFPFMSIHFYLKESVKDAPCLLDTLQQVVDLATQTLHVFHLCGSCVCVCVWMM